MELAIHNRTSCFAFSQVIQIIFPFFVFSQNFLDIFSSGKNRIIIHQTYKPFLSESIHESYFSKHNTNHTWNVWFKIKISTILPLLLAVQQRIVHFLFFLVFFWFSHVCRFLEHILKTSTFYALHNIYLSQANNIWLLFSFFQ